MILIINTDSLLKVLNCYMIVLKFKIEVCETEVSLLKSGILSQTFCNILHSLFVFMNLDKRNSQPIVNILLCIRILKLKQHVFGITNNLLVILGLKEFLHHLIFLLQQVLVNIYRMMIAFG